MEPRVQTTTVVVLLLSDIDVYMGITASSEDTASKKSFLKNYEASGLKP